MQVFKCAMCIIKSNIIFPIIYIIGLSFMGIFMAQSFDFGGIEEEINSKNVNFSIVDRDGSQLSESIAELLDEHGIRVEIEDERMAFQDAVAKGKTDYILVIPDGYEADFRSAVLNGEEVSLNSLNDGDMAKYSSADEALQSELLQDELLQSDISQDEIPQMDVIFSYYSIEGMLLDEAVNSYLGVVRTMILENPNESMDGILAKSSEIVTEGANVHVIDTGDGMSEADRFTFYLSWSTYTLFAGIVVCVGVLISTTNRADVRRRNLASAMSYLSYNLQLALACAVLAIAAFAWTFILGVIAFPNAAASMSTEGLLLSALSVFAYSLMALAFGFMIGQFGAGSLVCNAVGNIVGMVISFMAGAWISLDLMSPEVIAIAHWLPGYWYSSACQASADLISGVGANIADIQAILVDIGVVFLFAVALLGIGMVAAKRRSQTAEAGGNRAAEVLSK